MSTTSKRGFAALSIEKRRLVASMGGKVAWERGKAHRFTHEEAKLAGAKGGRISSRGRAESKNHEPKD